MSRDAIGDAIRIMFRCDGGRTPEIGTGHVARCSRLAEALLAQGGVEPSFVMQDNDFSREFARGAGWKVHTFPEKDMKACAAIFAKRKPDIIVVDRLDSDPAFMEMANPLCKALVSFDDLGPGASLADMVINGIVGDGKTVHGHTGYAGPRYVITPPELATSLKEIRDGCKHVFVSFGGYDHLNLTLKSARALESLDPSREVRLVVGGAYPFWSELEAFLKTSKRRFSLHKTPANYAELLTSSDLAIISGGLTLFEAMTAGVPALVLAQYEHQVITGKTYMKAGAADFLGMGDAVAEAEIMRRATGLISDRVARQRMSRSGQRLVDGEGLSRTTDLIRVVKPLKWDSDFFKIRIAKVTAPRITQRMASFIDSWCASNSIRCLYYLCDCDHAESVRVAEAHGFHFTDIRVSFEMDMQDYAARGADKSVRGCTEADLPAIKDIARRSYSQSRYYYDGHFDTATLERFYSDWLETTFRSPRGKVFVAHKDGKPVGYISGEIDNRGRLGRIILVGVDEQSAGSGVGKHLVDAMLDWMHGQKAYVTEVVTQGRNIPAQRLYQKSGFKMVSAHIWYHKWF